MDQTENLLNWAEYTKLLVGLLALVNPLYLIPIFMDLTVNRTPADKKRIALVAVGVFLVILLAFTFIGNGLLSILGISIEAFQISGGILLLIMGLGMMGALSGSSILAGDDASEGISLGFVPLGIPLLAGPGAMSIILIYSNRQDSLTHNILVSAVIISVAIIVFLSLYLSVIYSPKLSKSTIDGVNRIMGLIIAAIGMEFIIDGLAVHFSALVK
jgi:multiple antibiotic resistance protein